MEDAKRVPSCQALRAAEFDFLLNSYRSIPRAPVAQLDRALVSGTKGRTFESCRAYHLNSLGSNGLNGCYLTSRSFGRPPVCELVWDFRDRSNAAMASRSAPPSVCRWISVVTRLSWPRIFWMLPTGTPLRSMIEAPECRSGWKRR